MLKRRRGRFEVFADILSEALNGANKTRIMYRANLNFLRFHRYLSELLGKGMIATENASHGRVVYRTTDKGRRFLKSVNDAEEIISS